MAVIAAPVVRIRPARWFAHADALVDLGALVAERARALACARDPRAPFALAYKRYITTMWTEVEAGRFGDATAWVAQLTVEHANGWLRAMDSYERGEYALVPGTWRGVFARQRHGLDAATSMRISIAAHLLYDLPMALGRTDSAALDANTIARAGRAHRHAMLCSFGYGGVLRGRSMRRAHDLGWREGVALANARTDAARGVIFERARMASLRAIAS